MHRYFMYSCRESSFSRYRVALASSCAMRVALVGCDSGSKLNLEEKTNMQTVRVSKRFTIKDRTGKKKGNVNKAFLIFLNPQNVPILPKIVAYIETPVIMVTIVKHFSAFEIGTISPNPTCKINQEIRDSDGNTCDTN